MTTVAEIMDREPPVISPRHSLQQAAAMMEKLHVSALMVFDADVFVCLLTERDIIVRGVARGKKPTLTIQQFVSGAFYSCDQDDDVGDVTRKMIAAKIQSLPVLDHF